MGFFDMLMGKDSADASRKAAADTYGKQVEASQVSRNVGNQYQQNMYGLSERFDPYRQTGQLANDLYANFIGANGADAQRGAYDSYVASPAVDWLMGQGGRAIDNSASARSMNNSGATLKALMRFGQGTAMGGLDNNLNRLQAMGQQGLGATQMGVNTAGQGYQGQLQGGLQSANQLYGSAGTIGQGDIAAAQARSQGLTNTIGLGMNAAGMLMGMPSMGGSGGGFGSSFTGNTSNPFSGVSGATTSFQGGVPYPMFG